VSELKALQRQKRITPVGRFVYGALIEPRTTDFGKTEWLAAVVLSEADSEPLFAAIEEVLAAKRADNSKFPADNSKLRMPFRPSEKKNEAGEKELVEGEFLWTFTRRLERKGREGETVRNTPPVIYDSLGNVITGKLNMIGGGTMGKAVYEMYVYDAPANKGVSLQLVGFQISELSVAPEQKLDPIEGGSFVLANEEAEIEALLSGIA
jgi:hypothetical protein